MMEPDIRIKTNELGFCKDHFSKITTMRRSLPVALIMESHLKHVSGNLMAKKVKRKHESPISQMINSCYVCDKIEWALNTMVDTICRLWKDNDGFREMYTSHDHICLYHYDKVMNISSGILKRDDLKTFGDATLSLTQKYLDELCNDVSHFCKMYDYRNTTKDADWGNSKGSVDRAITFLSKK